MSVPVLARLCPRNMTRLLDWRAALVYLHRWFGIVGCLLFVSWFVSGVVLMYVRMPSLSAEERLSRTPPVDLTAARIEPAAAAFTTGFSPETIRVNMLAGRPVYRFNAGSRWATVYADTGERLSALTVGEAAAVAREFVPEHAATLRYETSLHNSDQWTLSAAMRPLMPLYRFGLGDSNGSTLYVSALTGEPVMKTTRRERLWNYAGAVTHWLYFTPLRRNSGLWVDVVIWLSLAGCVLCLSGLVWGVWRFSPSARFRLKRAPTHSPYAGMMKWHHYAGLVFGLTTSTWMFSGLMSMTPWNWSPGHSPTRPQREAATGGPVAIAVVTLDGLRGALRALSAAFVPKELEVASFQGMPFVTAYRPSAELRARAWLNTDDPAFIQPVMLERQMVLVSSGETPLFTRFGADAVMEVARHAMPGANLTEAVWLNDYDAYCYDRDCVLALPVLRARYDDEVATWLYIDPSKGAIVQKEERRTRLERWLYHGLHSFDFAFLYARRPLWDVVLVVLSAGGVVLSMASVVPAWRRVRRQALRWSAQGRSAVRGIGSGRRAP